jgi:hypothetical protein
MKPGYRIFLQALALSLFGHALFFSIFNVQDNELKKKEWLLPITMLQMKQFGASRVEAATTSNPELIDPRLVQLAKKISRTASPKLEAHREGIVWEEEMTAKTIEPDILSWLAWSFRRNMPVYGDLFENPVVFSSFHESELPDMGEEIEPVNAKDDEISTSFSKRKLLKSSLPQLPADMAGFKTAPVRLRVGVSRTGNVRFALPEKGSANMLATIASNEVRKWRFSALEGFDDGESEDNIEWGWIIVPFGKASTSDIIKESGGIENTGAHEK